MINHVYTEAGYHEWDQKRILRTCRMIECNPEQLVAWAGGRYKPSTEFFPVSQVLHFVRLEEFIARTQLNASRVVTPSDILAGKILGQS